MTHSITLGDYLASLEDRNWHTLAALIRYERGEAETEEDIHDMLSVYLTAKNKREAMAEQRRIRKAMQRHA